LRFPRGPSRPRRFSKPFRTPDPLLRVSGSLIITGSTERWLDLVRRSLLLMRKAWKPLQPLREVPVRVAEELHRGREEDAADQRRVDENRGGEADAGLLELQ